MVLGKLWQRLRGAQSIHLVVEGVVIECGEHAPRTHLGPKQAEVEAFFSLQIEAAALSDGQPEEPAAIVPAEFTGDVALLQQFAVGDRVRVATTTRTGRQIAMMTAAR